MANSLHYVEDQERFIRACEPHMASRHWLIVKYQVAWLAPVALSQSGAVRAAD
jgi:hypothetical protein